MKEIKNIIYVNTVYSLLISLIMKPKLNENLYFFNEDFSSEIVKKIDNKVILKKYKENVKVIRYYKIRSFLKKLLKEYKMKLEGKVFYLQDHLTFSQFFFNNFNNHFYLIEDGVATYNEKLLEEALTKGKKTFLHKFTYCLKNIYTTNGTSSKIEKVYMLGILPIPKLLKKKVELLDIKKRWQSLSDKEKIGILNIFNINLDEVEKLKNEENKVLIITQTFSEDKLLTEEEKLEIYDEIIKKYKENIIYIKPHPRERSDYKKIFSEYNIQILRKEFPLELLDFLDVKFTKVITVCSTAAFNFKGKSEVEFIGTEKYPKLYKIYGKVEFQK